jgi:hypothetical protein
LDRTESFEQFLASSSAAIAIPGFLVNLLLAAVLSMLLGKVYSRYGTAISNRDAFSRNFMILGMTIMVIITIVKSSLALSLGLVGALSIVRFRTAIKEPEELAYTFLTIAIGLGLGADQVLVTVVSFATIVGLIIIRSSFFAPKSFEYSNLRIAGNKNIEISRISDILANHTLESKLRRVDELDERTEILYGVVFQSLDQLVQTREEVRKLDETIEFSYFDSLGAI